MPTGIYPRQLKKKQCKGCKKIFLGNPSQDYCLKRCREESYYSKNKGQIKQSTRKYKHQNKGKMREYYLDDRTNYLIRKGTTYKYGRLPKGWQYHHIPPYRVDVWLVVHQSEHKIIFDKFFKNKS